MVRRALLAALLVVAACSSGSPVVTGRPSGTPTSAPPASPSPTTTKSPSPSIEPSPTSDVARVYKLTQGQASLKIDGDLPFAGLHILDRGFSAPPEGSEKDGTYGWLTASGDTLVLNVPPSGPWTVSGRIEGTGISYAQCTVKADRNDPSGLAGSFTCGRVTRAGTVAPAGTAKATFNLEP